MKTELSRMGDEPTINKINQLFEEIQLSGESLSISDIQMIRSHLNELERRSVFNE